MRLSSLVLLVCSAVCGLVEAAPAARHGKSFTIARPHRTRPRNAQRALLKALSKYNMKLPLALQLGQQGPPTQSLRAADGSGETGSVPNRPSENDAEYLSFVNIGGQDIVLDFDTGSSDFWVFSTDMPAAQSAGHTVFDPAKSKTWKELAGQSWSISFGDYSFASGKTVGTDVVNIGGADFAKQAVELASRVSKSFVDDKSNNGIVGLGFSSLNTVTPTPQKTFLENIQPELTLPVFTANLKKGQDGAYEFGKIDQTQFTGDLTYVPVQASSGFWQFDSASFAVGDNPVQQNTEASPAVADTGTSLLLVDEPVLQGYWTKVRGAVHDENQGGVVFPCSEALPDLKLALGSYTATIPGALLNYVDVGPRDGVRQCFGALQSNQAQGVQILGDPLFKAQFAVFDIGKKAVGFAPHADIGAT